jgi:hypothetical protein
LVEIVKQCTTTAERPKGLGRCTRELQLLLWAELGQKPPRNRVTIWISAAVVTALFIAGGISWFLLR